VKKIRPIFQSSLLNFICFIFINIISYGQIRAQGNLNVNPSRVIFEGQKRITELNVNNDSQDSAKYVISFVQIRMTEDGVMQWITSPDQGQNFADKYIRVFPRTVRLGPNETQIVRLQLTHTEQLVTGEYRSHLYFKSLVPQKALGAEDIKKDSGVLLNIEATFGFTMPVFIRVGESSTMMNISDIKLEKNANGSSKLNLNLKRSGNMSVYGDLYIYYISPNGKETQIGLLGNIAVYTPNTLLRVKIDLDSKKNIDLTNGKIRVVYSSMSGTHTAKLAETELNL
jgi:hypothetical protein